MLRTITAVDVIYSGPDHLSKDEHNHFMHSITSFLFHYSFLNHEARRRNVLAYHVVSKFHYLYHIGVEARFINPRVGGCCLADEDFMGKKATLTRGCLKGRNSLTLIDAIIEQYARAMCVRWAGYSTSALEHVI